jgi:hypothetical protein
MYLVFGLWWLFDWLFAGLEEKGLLKFMWAT